MSDNTLPPESPSGSTEDSNDNDPRVHERSARADRKASRRRRGRFGKRWWIFASLPLAALGAWGCHSHAHGHDSATPGWYGHSWHGHAKVTNEAEMQKRMSRRAKRVLSHLDATDEQRAEIDALIVDRAPALFAMRVEGRELKAEFAQALIDGNSEEIERLRVAGVAHLDKASELWIRTAQTALAALDEEQRAEVMEHFERRTRWSRRDDS